MARKARMTRKYRHLIAALGVGAISASIFVYIAWMLFTGEVNESISGSRIRSTSTSSITITYTREDDPGVYWMIVGLFTFFGGITTIVAVLEYRSYLIHKEFRSDGNPGTDLLAKIDQACKLYPEVRETLLRARAAVVDLKDPGVEIALGHFLDTALTTHDRRSIFKDLRSLAKALDRISDY